MTRHFLKDSDLSPQELGEVLMRAERMKARPYDFRPLAGPQTVALIFDKTSTRTRVSFAAGIAALGGEPLIINPGESQLGHKESIEDSAKVFSRMVSAIVWRTFEQIGLEKMAASASVPVINSLSDSFHPCQLLADLLTIREHKGNDSHSKVQGLTLAYFGDGANNMANSYALAGVNAGMHVRIAAPIGYQPAHKVQLEADLLAAKTGGSLTVTDDAHAAADGADVLTTDTWVSMGQEHAGRDDAGSPFTRFRVTKKLMDAGNKPIFLHCLPAYRGKEVDAEVIDGPCSVVFDEAENRVHAQKALLQWLVEHS